MAEIESLNYLEAELSERIENFNSSRKFYRSANNAIIMLMAVFSAAATILIGVSQRWPSPWISIPALISSASVTVFTAYDGFLRSRDLWILKDDTWVALKNLQGRIQYAKAKSAASLTQHEIDTFFARYNDLLLHEHETWRSLRTIRDQDHLPSAIRVKRGEVSSSDADS